MPDKSTAPGHAAFLSGACRLTVRPAGMLNPHDCHATVLQPALGDGRVPREYAKGIAGRGKTPDRIAV